MLSIRLLMNMNMVACFSKYELKQPQELIQPKKKKIKSPVYWTTMLPNIFMLTDKYFYNFEYKRVRGVS